MKRLTILIRQADSEQKALENLDTVITACLFDCSAQLVFFEESINLSSLPKYREKLQQTQDIGDVSLYALIDHETNAESNADLPIESLSKTQLQEMIHRADEVVSL